MKYLFWFSLSFFAAHFAYGQTQKGSHSIGGSLRMNIGNDLSSVPGYNSDSKNFSFSISPSFQHFVADNFSIGTFLNFDYQEDLATGNNVALGYQSTTSKLTTTTYGAGLFSRYYFDISRNLNFYLNGSLSYSNASLDRVYTRRTSQIDEPSVDESQIRSDRFFISLNSGLIYFVNRNLGLTASFGSVYYNYSISTNLSNEEENSRRSGDLVLDFSLSSVNLGLSYFF